MARVLPAAVIHSICWDLVSCFCWESCKKMQHCKGIVQITKSIDERWIPISTTAKTIEKMTSINLFIVCADQTID